MFLSGLLPIISKGTRDISQEKKARSLAMPSLQANGIAARRPTNLLDKQTSDAQGVERRTQLKQLAENQKISLILTHLLPDIQRRFSSRGHICEGDQGVRIFQDLDRGVEWCEEQILLAEESRIGTARQADKEGILLESAFDDIMKSLEQQERFETLVEDLKPYLERCECVAGECLISKGAPPEAVYFIESGRVTVQFAHHDAKAARLRTMNAGTVVGELGVYLKQPASASVIMQEPGTVYRLRSQALQRMKIEDPQKIIRFHEFMAYLLCERLVNTNTTLQAVLD